eukprot:195746-Prymnesium_polylepis.1
MSVTSFVTPCTHIPRPPAPRRLQALHGAGKSERTHATAQRRTPQGTTKAVKHETPPPRQRQRHAIGTSFSFTFSRTSRNVDT